MEDDLPREISQKFNFLLLIVYLETVIASKSLATNLVICGVQFFICCLNTFLYACEYIEGHFMSEQQVLNKIGCH